MSTEAKDLIKELLNKDPVERISLDDALNHPWIKVLNYVNNYRIVLFYKIKKFKDGNKD